MPALLERFGKYHVLARIAHGGMAEVYQVKTVGLAGFEKVQALKRILPNFAREPRFIRSFIDEARIAVELNHRNIVQVFDFGKAAGELFLAMELIDGIDLRTAVADARDRGIALPIPLACYIVGEVGAGLDYAHRKTDLHGESLGIVHCDVSPQNVMLSYEGYVKILDFGVARARFSAQPHGGRRLRGKPRYMAPEQTLGDIPTAATDVFALGIITWELLTGLPLFEGDDLQAVLEAVRRADAPPVDKLNPDVPARLAAAVSRALSTDPAARGTSAELATIMTSTAQLWDPQGSARSMAQWLEEVYPNRDESRPTLIDRNKDDLSIGSQPTASILVNLEDRPGTEPIRMVPAHETSISSIPTITIEIGTPAAEPAEIIDEDEEPDEPARLLEKRRVVAAVVLVEGGTEPARRELISLLGDLAYKRGAVVHAQDSDSLVVVFGLEVAGEDDVAHAMSYALDAVETAREASAQAQGELAMRIAARAGIVATPDDHGGYRLVGDSVEETRELARGAEPNRPLLSGGAGRLTSTYYAFRELLARRHRRRRVRVLELIGPRGFDERHRTLHARRGRFFGRQRELVQLSQALARAVTEDRPVTVALISPSGVGKSRLIAEFVARAEATARPAERPMLIAVAAIPGAGTTPFSLLIELIQAALDLPPGRGEAARGRLTMRARHVLGQAGHTPESAAELAGALELAMELRDGALALPWHATADLREQVSGAMQALRDALMPAQRPMISVIEDLHFADSSSVEAIKTRILGSDRGGELIVLTATGDAEVAGGLAEWVDEVIELAELAGTELGELISDRLADTAMPRAVNAIIERAGGNPLLVEQLALEARDVGEIPPTARAVIMSRVDRLAPQTKAVLQHAAVAGRRFRGRILEELLGREIIDELEDLCADDLVRRSDGGSADSLEGELSFTCGLIAEVVYESLSAGARRDTHARLGRLLAARFRAGRDEPPAMVAEHLERGGILAAAAAFWLRAGRLAAAACDARAAIEHFSRTLTNEDQRSQRGETTNSSVARARTREALAGCELAYGRLGDHQAQSDALDRLRQMAAGNQAELADVEARTATRCLRLGDYSTAITAAERAEVAARDSNSELLLGVAMRLRGEAYQRLSHFHRSLELTEGALGIFRRIGATREETEAMISMGRNYLLQAHYEQARFAYRPIIERVRRSGDSWLERVVANHVAVIHLCLGEYEDAFAAARRAIEICQRHGDRAREGDSMSVYGSILIEIGCFDEAWVCLSHALTIHNRTGSRWSRADCLVYAGRAEAELGEIAHGLEHLKESITLARAIGASYVEANALVGLAGALLMRNQPGDVELARKTAARAVEVSREAKLISQEIEGLSRQADATRRGGDPRSALELAERARTLLERQRHVEGSEEEIHYVHYCILRDLSDARAPAMLQRARAGVERKLAALANPEWRRTFMHNVRANAAIMAADSRS